jgi:adenylate kinase
MLNIVLFGPPGAGKGTQSERIIKKYGLTHISTGELLRKHMCEGTALGKTAQKYIDDGRLVPDELVIEMVELKIDENKNTNGFIFDGFPRTVIQAGALDDLLKRKNQDITIMIALEVKDEELIKRLLERGKTSGRSDDQNIDRINTRIKVYEKETMPVIKYYIKQGKFSPVNGVGSIEDIFSNICEIIDQKAMQT